MLNLSLEFETVSLGEHLYIKGRIGWKGLKKEEYLENGNYKIINATAIEDDGINWNECGYITKDRFDESPEIILKEKDILISKDGTIGKIGYVKSLDGPSTVASGIFVVRNLNEDYINTDFLYHYFKSPFFKWFIKSATEGSVIPHLYQRDFADMEFILFDLDTQNKCAKILNNIDEKIRINKEINKNLEEQILTIFVSWFFKFDLNDEFKDSKLGLIPKDWSIDYLGSNKSCSIIGSGIPQFTGLKNYIATADVDNTSIVNENNFVTMKNKPSRANMSPTEKSIWFAKMIDSRKLIMVDDYSKDLIENYIFSTGFCGLKCLDKYFYYLWSFLLTNTFDTMKNNFCTGTTMQAINNKDTKMIEFVLPDDNTLFKFDKIAKPVFEKIYYNNLEIKKLTKLRDVLLPKLMSGEIDVSKINCDLKIIVSYFIPKNCKFDIEDYKMKTKIISKIQNKMKPYLDQTQYLKLTNALLNSLKDIELIDNNNELNEMDNFKLLNLFLSAKQVEGCSDKTIVYYKSTIEKMLEKIKKQVYNITTDDLRKYLFNHKYSKNSSKTTIDNIRRIFSSFFSWLEDEDYILKNPVRRIHRVKTGRVVKEVLTDENLEILRDNCDEIRDLAMVELLTSTGIRVGELVRLNIEDVDFYERECVVFGKGESERVVYFDARTKIHLIEYLQKRNDNNPALFVSLNKPFNRLGISGVETRIRELGKKCNIKKVHPHKFRRTMATNAIDKGMPIEQVQKLLGHVQIDTTMQYAMVNQSNVKLAHRKFIG